MKERILRVADRLFYQRGIRAMGGGHHRRGNRDQQADALQPLPLFCDRRLSGAPRRVSRSKTVGKPAFDTLRHLRHPRAPLFREQRIPRLPVRECGDRTRTRGTRGPATWPSPSRKAEGCGSAICWCSSVSPIPTALAMQLAILVDGAIAAHLVRGDPAMARAAKDAATALLQGAGVAHRVIKSIRFSTVPCSHNAVVAICHFGTERFSMQKSSARSLPSLSVRIDLEAPAGRARQDPASGEHQHLRFNFAQPGARWTCPGSGPGIWSTRSTGSAGQAAVDGRPAAKTAAARC